MEHIESLTRTYDRNDGISLEFTFANGYGASVIKSQHSYGGKDGLWELAVLDHGVMCYDTVITNDVLGHLTWKEVEKTLERIKEL